MENENGAMGNPFLNHSKSAKTNSRGSVKFTDEPAAPAPQPFNVPQQLINNTQQPMEPIVQTPIQSEAAVETQVKYAGFWVRWAANFIDGLILTVPIIIIGVVFSMLSLQVFGTIFLYVILFSYFIFMTKSYGATLGKKALGIKVISDKSEELSWGQVILRETIGKIISGIILYIGYIMAGFTRRKQALHDMIASTTVVYKDPNKKPRGFIIGLIIGLVLVIPIIGILASIVLVSLNSARQKASDAAVKATMQSMVPEAINYYDSANNSFKGFKTKASLSALVKSCSGDPIMNISLDGQNMVILAKSCSKSTVYYCEDVNSDPSYNGQIVEVDEQYAKSGAVSCSKALNQIKADLNK